MTRDELKRLPFVSAALATVCVKESGIIITESIHNNVLSFPTKEMAEDFLGCFKDLCKTAKILL